MAVYVWEGRTRAGEIRKGDMEAPNESAVMAQLRQQQILPTKVKEKGKGLSMEIKIPGLGEKVKEKDIVIFTRQFSTMVDAGLPLVQGLDILATQQMNKTFKDIITKVKESVEGGSTLADAMKKHPRIFDDLYVNLVAAGEVGGILDNILARLALYIEKAMKLKSQVKSAMVYPIGLATVAVAVTIVMLVFVIPVFAKMFADFGGSLPGPTQFVIDLSDFLKRYIILIIVVMAAIYFIFRSFYRTEKGRAIVDDLLLKLPVVGDLIRKIAVARFTRVLGTMISSGVPILDALDICSRTAGNKTVETAIMEARKSIAGGKTIAEPLKDTDVFPPMVVQMIAVGEATGAMDAMLSKIADFYDEEVDAAVGTLMSMLEPAMVVLIGGVIGGLLMSMYLPIFKIAGTIG
jgi:type IV pilus assembly protein PilC